MAVPTRCLFVDAAPARPGRHPDVVDNHLGPDGNYLRDFAPQYYRSLLTFLGSGNQLRYFRGSAWVRKLVLDNVRYRLNEFHADGLRLDATHAIFDDLEGPPLG